MENLIKTVETFLVYSEEKLEELAQKNQNLKTDYQLQKDNRQSVKR